ncbi:hypothetical protein [Stutzerimonas chloritidismutans]|uniref:Uncharacterized protein n=1 Tax=Stutzerimonas chloritidismutans TaxID=203192 RepID=A0ABU9M9J7_STUCH
MPWFELGIRTTAALAGITAALVLYTHTLLLLGSRLNGAKKITASVAAYLLLAGAIGAGLLYILDSSPDGLTLKSWSYLATVMAAWVLVVTPGILYLRNYMARLQSMGYFLARW